MPLLGDITILIFPHSPHSQIYSPWTYGTPFHQYCQINWRGPLLVHKLTKVLQNIVRIPFELHTTTKHLMLILSITDLISYGDLPSIASKQGHQSDTQPFLFSPRHTRVNDQIARSWQVTFIFIVPPFLIFPSTAETWPMTPFPTFRHQLVYILFFCTTTLTWMLQRPFTLFFNFPFNSPQVVKFRLQSFSSNKCFYGNLC